MTSASSVTPPTESSRSLLWLGVVLLIVGFFCHFFAAPDRRVLHRVPRPSLGFVLLTVVSGLIVWALGLRFWKRRYDVTIFIVGVIQAVLGVLVYIQRFHVHG